MPQQLLFDIFQGYVVWMDIDDMEGSTLQAMARAVEEAVVVMSFMSQKYKDSPNTRAGTLLHILTFFTCRYIV